MSKYFLFSIFYFVAPILSADRIVDIEVKGAVTMDPNVLISTSGLEIGDEFTPLNIREAIEQIYNIKLFEDVRIEQEKVGGGIKLIIYVKECLPLLKVAFEGNKKFKSDKLKEISGLKEKWSAFPSTIFDAKVKIKKAYEKEGYYLTEVTPEVTEEGGKIYVKYLINEGKPTKIRKIEIVGNQTFSDKRLKHKLKNREKYWWPWSGKFNKDEFENDPIRVIEFYNNNGYPNCKLKNVEIVPVEMWIFDEEKWVCENKEWITIKIEIDEGEKFYFGDVGFEGNKVFETKELARGVGFKKHELYSKLKLAKTMEWIYGMYGDKGYLYLNVDPVESLTDSIVDIMYKLREGKPAKIRKIVVQDNMKTHEKVIRRELTVYPGEIFCRSKLIASYRKVYNLGFFKNITLDTRQANPQGDIDLIIKVEEKEAGTASVGASYYPKHGFAGNFSISAPNFRGQGEHFFVSLEKGQRMDNMLIGYRKPWVFDTPLTVGMRLYHTFEARVWYRMRKTGGEIDIGRDIPRLTYTKARTSYRLENVKVEGVTDATLLSHLPQGMRSAITFGVNRDSRDNFLNPTVGTRNDIEVEFSGGILGGGVDYHRQVLESSTYHTLGWKFVLGLRSQFGIVSGYKSPKEVPIYERFVLGGIGKWGLRGYGDWTVGGPMTIEGTTVGGRFASIFTIEVKIAFTPHNIYPLVFLDAGNTWESISEANLQDLKRGAGVGFRIEIPMMGLVGFDLGYRLDPTLLQRNRGWEFHLQMGRIF